jgi:hypothetical protein
VTLRCDAGIDPPFPKNMSRFCTIAVRMRSADRASDGDKPRLTDCTLVHFLSFFFQILQTTPSFRPSTAETHHARKKGLY